MPFTAAAALVALANVLAAPSSDAHAVAAAMALNPLPHPLEVETLPNGLTVVTTAFDSPGIVAYYTLVRAGSRDEVEPGKGGYAHLFEHLMFRGTDAVPPDEYMRRLQSFGADDNASTSEDWTIYRTTIPSDALVDLVRINADRFQHLHVAPDKYKDETGAVLGERNKSFASPEAQMEEALAALAFKSHTYGHTTIGSKHDVEDMPNQYEYSRAFFRRFYTPDDCVIFVVGELDRAKTLAAIKDAYGGWTGKRARSDVRPEPEQKKARVRALVWAGSTEARLQVAYRIPAARTSLADTAALATLVAAMFGEQSDLYQRLVVRERKLLELTSVPSDVIHEDPGLLPISATLTASASFDEVIGAIQAALASTARGELSAARVEAARDHLLNQAILRAQTPSALATMLATMTGAIGDVHALERYTEALAAVKPEDVTRVAKLLVPAHRDVVTLVPGAAK